MNYEQKYNEALERARKEYKTHEAFNGFRVMLLNIFPELEETDGERIRKALIKYFNAYASYSQLRDNVTAGDAIAWLEKQDEQKSVEWSEEEENDMGTLWYAERWLNTIKEKYQRGWHDVIEKQGEQKPSEWSKEDENECNHILKILNLVSEEQEIKGYNNLISSINWLKSIKYRIQSKQSNKPQGKTAIEAIEEEKVDNSNKIERPKFEVGDWIVQENIGVYQVIEICECWYEVVDNKNKYYSIGFDKEHMLRLWTLEDAKDGDILYSKKHNLLWRYKNTKECYYCINLNYNSNNISIGDIMIIPNDARPASKEQRDLAFDKMLQHTFSEINGKKELKKQGEHNPTDNDDKIEPKFKVGDWIVYRDAVWKVCNIALQNDYELLKINNEVSTRLIKEVDENAHLWTIEDAKDGDVLVASDGSIFIFAGVVDYTCNYYAALTHYNDVSINKEVELGSWELSNHVHPATKEQCDLLFAKMREKGYKWNNEKKEVIGRI